MNGHLKLNKYPEKYLRYKAKFSQQPLWESKLTGRQIGDV